MPRALRTAGAMAVVAGIGMADTVVSPRLPFAILYFLPVIAIAWYASRGHAMVVAAAAITARIASDIHWNGTDQWTLTLAVLWGGAFLLAPWVTTWAHTRRDELSALEGRFGELQQIERSFAHTDPLTSLSNRRAFIDALQRAEARGRRTGERLAVARLDIGGFKALNDVYSRNEGDQLLRAVATSLSLTIRMGDLAARLEGDQFALLLYNCGPENALKVGQRAIEEVAELGRAYPDARVTASVGIACFTAPGPDPDGMMLLAGAALQRARHEAGSVVVESTESVSGAGPQSGDTSNVR